MNWNNLKNNRCPKCNSYLGNSVFEICCNSCDFKCSITKFDEIVDSLYKPKKQYINDDNSSALNNLGHDLITDDFR